MYVRLLAVGRTVNNTLLNYSTLNVRKNYNISILSCLISRLVISSVSFIRCFEIIFFGLVVLVGNLLQSGRHECLLSEERKRLWETNKTRGGGGGVSGRFSNVDTRLGYETKLNACVYICLSLVQISFIAEMQIFFIFFLICCVLPSRCTTTECRKHAKELEMLTQTLSDGWYEHMYIFKHN